MLHAEWFVARRGYKVPCVPLYEIVKKTPASQILANTWDVAKVMLSWFLGRRNICYAVFVCLFFDQHNEKMHFCFILLDFYSFFSCEAKYPPTTAGIRQP